ncbi:MULTISPECIES: AlbA family DNA-binding domain-containing protein [Acidithiobacillus]|jgi:predicted HTH transcriptional regulator|uniref:Conserved domain protein n=2 Tax=Acidithiobacillus ferrooxidans TaxID=920 RepID=B7J6E4_ACIF2|nr:MULTISPECIES: RNA-binding domain-containing protein [Acidithiobacillus]EGQ63043.1 hypothetical protein GGI1_16674 [Acidithiobacillus sp. GGI-221]MCL5957549.1 ATP-binding protein [Gammaproteobacteria bacterium]ACH84228.1 putative transcriptional regulator [Acidithiobacillus ferrooxidans ATCC 53993]ACK79889.1 conserved domain protein [Acidithiobacillus ferrooxidans ATCC 23270]MBN6745267.1 putative DNA binding domain-containing protein [Acidithiobacillus sp. MC2.2]
MSEQPLAEATLLARIALGEHTRQQFKRSFHNPDALAAELAAFANSGGGTLLIGVTDDGIITGLSEHAFRMLPYRGLGSGIPRALDEWSQIELIDEVSGNQFTARVQRPKAQWAGAGEQATEQVEAPVTEQVTEQVRRLCVALGQEAKGTKELMQSLNLKHRPSFLEDYLNPALQQRFVELTQPDSPRSPTQKYRLTAQGKVLLK